jgi:hypothetical protein
MTKAPPSKPDKPDQCSVPVIEVGGYRWGALCYIGSSKKHIIAAERCKTESDHSYTFKGGHKISLFKLENHVHWRLPDDWDITSVATPRRTLK